MPTWLDVVKMKLDSINIKELPDPSFEVNINDHVVGEADTDMKRLYCLAVQFGLAAVENLIVAGNVDNRDSYIEKAAELHQKSELLMEIFWTSIKDTFNLWEKPSVGIRKGWKVVWHEQRRKSETVVMSMN